jgi:CheY-like chemotaxis protein
LCGRGGAEQVPIVIHTAEDVSGAEQGNIDALMDLMMPELDGYDTIRVIRGLEQFRVWLAIQEVRSIG